MFAYFEGVVGERKEQEQIRFAISYDAVNWKALNNNEPILNSDDISQSGGIEIRIFYEVKKGGCSIW